MQADWVLKRDSDITEQDWLNWQQLVDSDHAGNLVFHRYFVSCLLKYFVDGYYLAIYQPDAKVRQMCFLKRRQGVVWQLVHPSQATSALIVGQCETDWQGLFQSLPGFAWRLDLYSLDIEDHRYIIETNQPKQLSPANLDITVDLRIGLVDYMRRRPKKLRQNLDRYHRRLTQDGKSLRFQVVTASCGIDDAVRRYAQMEFLGWKGQQGTALDQNNAQTRFYRDVLTFLATQNSVLIAELYADNELLASRLCMFNSERFICLKTTYNETQKQYAPGRLLLYKLLEYLFETRTSSKVDFYTNTNADQIDWSTHARLFYNCSIYKNNSVALLGPLLAKIIKLFNGTFLSKLAR